MIWQWAICNTQECPQFFFNLLLSRVTWKGRNVFPMIWQWAICNTQECPQFLFFLFLPRVTWKRRDVFPMIWEWAICNTPECPPLHNITTVNANNHLSQCAHYTHTHRKTRLLQLLLTRNVGSGVVPHLVTEERLSVAGNPWKSSSLLGAKNKARKDIKTSRTALGVARWGRISHPTNPSGLRRFDQSLHNAKPTAGSHFSSDGDLWRLMRFLSPTKPRPLELIITLYKKEQNWTQTCKSCVLIQNQPETEELTPGFRFISTQSERTWCRIYVNEPIPW